MHKVALQGEKWAREVDTVCNKIGKMFTSGKRHQNWYLRFLEQADLEF